MATALFAPPDSLAPGLADSLTALGRPIEELPWGGDLRSGVDVAGCEVLVTVAPLPRLGPLAEIDPAAWTATIREIAERPAAAARALLSGGGGGKRWIAVIPHLSSLPSPGSGPYGAGGVLLQTVLRVAVIENASSGFCANAIAVGPLARQSRRGRRAHPAGGHAAREADADRGAGGARPLARRRRPGLVERRDAQARWWLLVDAQGPSGTLGRGRRVAGREGVAGLEAPRPPGRRSAADSSRARARRRPPRGHRRHAPQTL